MRRTVYFLHQFITDFCQSGAATGNNPFGDCGREDGQVLLRDVVAKGSASGFDASAQTEEVQIVDMFEAGIIDPVKVTRSCVENAASAASVLLMTEAAVADIPEEKKNSSGGGGGMPGGMGMGEDM